jgi:hypothetical protein
MGVLDLKNDGHAEGSGFRVQGSGFRIQGSGFRIQGSGKTIAARLRLAGDAGKTTQ